MRTSTGRQDRSSELVARATDATGLSEFGEQTFREGLEVLVASLDSEARLNELGRASLDTQIIDLLCPIACRSKTATGDTLRSTSRKSSRR